jgi:hypothetical protein
MTAAELVKEMRFAQSVLTVPLYEQNDTEALHARIAIAKSFLDRAIQFFEAPHKAMALDDNALERATGELNWHGSAIACLRNALQQCLWVMDCLGYSEQWAAHERGLARKALEATTANAGCQGLAGEVSGMPAVSASPTNPPTRNKSDV